MRKGNAIWLALAILGTLVVACGDLPTSTSVPQPTPRPTAVPIPTSAPVPTPTPITPLPTFTPFRAPTATPTPTATPYVLPTFTPVITGPSLVNITRAKAAFRFAYNQAVVKAPGLEPQATLVLAQTTLLGVDRTIWVFYLVKANPSKMWVITYDTARTSPLVDDTRSPLLLGDAGLIDPDRVLDSGVLAQRLLNQGFPSQTPVDSMLLQVHDSPDNKRVAAWYLVSTGMGRQLVVNAYSGDIIENTFNR